MLVLEAQICDVWGEPLAGATIIHTTDGGGLEVTDPLNDSRTARLTISVYDQAAKYARPLDRVLSVTYGSHLIFKGPILQALTDYAAGTCEIHAHDPTIKLKHHYLRYDDRAVFEGYPVDGRGLKILIESSLPATLDTGDDSGIPPNGIMWGHDNTTHQDPRPDGFWQKAERGANLWERVQNLSQALIGPDFRFRPVDRDHPGVYPESIFQYGFFVELDSADRLGSDKSDTVIFEHGLGVDNAENVTHEPDGDMVRNHYTQVYPGGQRNKSDAQRKATATAPGSIQDYGYYEGYESGGSTNDTQAVLKERAKAWVKAYARPPDFFTVTPRISAPEVPKYPGEIKVGDVIRVRSRKGTRSMDEIGRIITATVSSIDQAGNSRVALECVPTILATVDSD